MRLRFESAAWLAVGAFALAFVSSLLFQVALPSQFYDVGSTDFVVRDLPVAEHLLAGQGLRLENGVVAIGFPLILTGLVKLTAWLAVPFETGLRVLALTCMGLTAVFLALTARQLWGPRLAWITPILWSTYPFALWLSGQNSTELPFMVFLFAGVWILARTLVEGNLSWGINLVAGMLFGGAILIRPGALLVPLLLGIVGLCTMPNATLSARVTVLSLLALGSLLVIAPWEWFVWNQTGHFVLISTGDLPSIKDGLTFGIVSKNYRVGIELSPQVQALMVRAQNASPHFRSTGDLFAFLLNEFVRDPRTVFEFFVLKAARSWYGTDSMRFEMFTLPLQLVYLFCGLLGLMQALTSRAVQRVLGISLFLLILYFWLVTIMVLPLLRYMIPAMGLVMVFVPGACLWLGAIAKRNRWLSHF